MSEGARVAIQKGIDRINAGDTDLAGIMSRRFFTYVPTPDEPDAATELTRFLAPMVQAAPDLHIEVDGLVQDAHGDLKGIAVLSGTWTAPLFESPADGETHRFEVPVRLRSFDDGLALNIDLETPAVIGIMREFGLVNPPDEMHLPPPHPVEIDDLIFKLVFTGQVADRPCVHLDGAQVFDSTAELCDDCAKDEIWPALRMCLQCGHVGCCDTSTNKHAKDHWERTGHPLIRSLRLDEGWMWCYEDNALFQKRTLERLRAPSTGAS